MSELIKAVEQIGETIEDFKQSHGKSLDKLTKRVDEMQDRIEMKEAERDRPSASVGGSSGKYSTEQREYKGVFLDWVRHHKEKHYEARLSQAQHELSKKDVTIGTPSAGGYALPEEIASAIENRVRDLNPFRQIVRVDQCGSNDYKALVGMGNGTTGWVSETGSRSATLTPELRERAPTMGEQYAYPTVSEWALDDIFFNVERWLVDDISADWAAQEAIAIVSGTGTNQPTGILNTTPTSTEDAASPMRGAGVIQFVGLQSPSSPTSATGLLDSLINLVHRVQSRYLQETDGVAFVMHRLTAATLRRQKAVSGGDYLWQPSVQEGRPDRLLGYPVYLSDAMPVIANDAFPILFGNFRRGYLLADRVGIRVTPNPYSVPGKVSFYVRRRLGGCVLNNDAIKALRIAD